MYLIKNIAVNTMAYNMMLINRLSAMPAYNVGRKEERITYESDQIYTNIWSLICGSEPLNEPIISAGKTFSDSPRRVPLYLNLNRIHNNVNLAAGVRFITHDVSDNMINNKLAKEGRTERLSEKIGCIEIMDNVFVGADTTILYDVRIGTNVIIGAGSLVNKDIPDNSVAAGVPARVIGTFEDFVEKRLKWAGGYCDCPPPLRGVSVSDETAEKFWERFVSDRLNKGD